MANRHPHIRDEAGTTLVELLVVIVLFSIVGAITTTGIVRGFNAQRDSTNVAQTLDGMRIATQRVRDAVRGADEVCASSTGDTLVLWTDDDEDGAVEEIEKDIFELDTSVTPPIFQRRVPTSGETQIIRDDILNGAIFVYDSDPARVATDQPAALECLDGVTVTDTVSRIRLVQVNFIVDHPDPASPDLTTSTAVRIRNADLAEPPNSAPDGTFTVDCPVGTQTCNFDASGSTDPDGLITNYVWDFGDGTPNGSGVTASHTYVVGDTDYDVTLLVVDDQGAVDTVPGVARPGLLLGNTRPVADFTFTCSGLQCTFDASASTDDGTITEYRWEFGDGTTSSPGAVTETHTYAMAGTYIVNLVVVDDGGALSDPVTTNLTVGTDLMRIESLAATINDKTNKYDVTFTIALSLTTAGNPGDGVTISVALDGGKKGTDSCSTGTSGSCQITVQNIPQAKLQTLEVTNVTDTKSTYTYAPAQDFVDEILVDKLGNETLYKDGTEVTP